MKKLLSVLMGAILSVSVCVGLIGCSDGTGAGGGNKPSKDPDKIQINVHVSDGGYGTGWLYQAAKDWESLPENAKYQIWIIPNNDEDYLQMENDIKNGTAQDIYYLSHPSISNLINGNYLVDLSQTVEEKIAGETQSVREKMKYYETNKAAFSDRNGEGLYAVPYGDSFTGFVFDFQLFKDKGWLFTQADGSLTLGRDGKPNTYDDGQPITVEEWKEMLNKIKNERDTYPFVYNTKSPAYVTSMIDSLFYQYAGEQEYSAFLSYEGEVTVDAPSGTEKIAVTKENGYKAYKAVGLRKSLEFVDEYLTNDQELVYPKSWHTTQYTHNDAQKDFLYNFEPTLKNPQAALLYDGIWWENEANSRQAFDTLVKRGYAERGYGKREYRIMMYPTLDGAAVNKSVLASTDCGAAFVVKQKNAEKQEKALDFLKFSTKDEYLKAFTLGCGAVRPYTYSLSAEELKTLTPFQRNVWEIVNDTENVIILRPDMQARVSPFTGTSSKLERYVAKSDAGSNYMQPFKGLMSITAAEYIDGMCKYNEDGWENWLGGK